MNGFKICCVAIVEYHSDIKRRKLLSLYIMDKLENITLTEINQALKDKLQAVTRVEAKKVEFLG